MTQTIPKVTQTSAHFVHLQERIQIPDQCAMDILEHKSCNNFTRQGVSTFFQARKTPVYI